MDNRHFSALKKTILYLPQIGCYACKRIQAYFLRAFLENKLSSIRDYWRMNSNNRIRGRNEKLMRSERSKKLVEYAQELLFDIDPTIVRVIWAVLAFCYGTGSPLLISFYG